MFEQTDAKALSLGVLSAYVVSGAQTGGDIDLIIVAAHVASLCRDVLLLRSRRCTSAHVRL